MMLKEEEKRLLIAIYGKRFQCFGCFKIRDTKEACCSDRYGKPYAFEPYFGADKTGDFPS